MNDQARDEASDQSVKAVIGIGASAGGLEALEAFFDTAPDDAGLAYAVVTHLSPNFKSLMDELLARHTRMTVQLVEDGMTLQPNQVYVIPPNREMIVAGGRLLLSDREPGPQIGLPIDTFFHSLAREYGRRAVAIVLSGTGGDGSHALEALRQSGGRVFVQEPDTAKFDGMPRAAIATGQVDEVLSPGEIGQRMQQMPDLLLAPPSINAEPADPEGEALHRIFGAIFGASSIDFEAYKTATVLRRIDRRIAATRSASISSYADLIEQDPSEAENLSRDLLIGVTHFFRDEDAFKVLSTTVIPKIVQSAGRDRPIRIWCAGCATGEEAYSIAMLVRQELDRAGLDTEAQIFATDLHRDYVDIAGRGVFPKSSLPAAWEEVWQRHVFDSGDNQVQVGPEVRRMVVFAHHNILSDPPFTRLDLMSCRNLLIYLQPEAQERALSLTSFGLRRGGYLFLGPSESLGDAESNYTVVDKRWRIYRKELDSLAFHVPDRRSADLRGRVVTPSLPRAARSESGEAQILPAYSAMLERFAPPGVLIDGQRQLIHTFGEARQYLRPPEGVASLDILQMVPEGLKLPIATAIDRAAREGREVRYEGASSGSDLIDITVFPTASDPEGRRGHKVVLLELHKTDDGEPSPVEVLNAGSISDARIEDLENELRYTRENLQATIEEVETSNEELQSTNEELMAANEELQSTNEELHSVNEELYSVNAEYQRKNDELIQLNRDMEALMGATDVGVLFVDENIAIRRFTKAVRKVINLIDEDRGRSLRHVTHRLIDADIAEIASRAVSRFAPTEQEFATEDDDWWLLRCMPMRTPDSSSIGAIITLIDITELKRATRKVETEARRNSLITEIGNAFVISSDTDLNVLERSRGWENYTGQDYETYRNRGWLDAILDDDRSRLATGDGDTAPTGPHTLLYRLYHQTTGRHRHCQAHLVPDLDSKGTTVGWTGVIVDVEDAIQSEQAVRKSEQVIRSIISDMPVQFAMMDRDGRYTLSNVAYNERWTDRETLIGASMDEVLRPAIAATIRPAFDAALQGHQRDFLIGDSPDHGEKTLFLGISAPIHDEAGDISGASVFGMDVGPVADMVRVSKEKESRFGQILLEGSGEYLMIDAATFDILQSSKGLRDNTGHTAERLQQMNLEDLLPEYDRKRLESLLGDLQHNGGRTVRLETFISRNSGATYDAEITIQRDETGARDMLAVSIADRSSQIATQQTLRARNEELAQTNSDLESFAYFASHDLKEPARKINNFASLLEADLENVLTEDAREYLQIIRRGSERQMQLIQDLLSFSRVRTRGGQFEDVSLAALMREIVDDVNPELKQAGGAIEVGEMPDLHGDAMLLRQLFANLVNNSIKYRSPEHPLKISIGADRENGWWRVSVTDNGIGFDMGDAEQIFGLFQRLHGPTSIPGTGVGLAICKRVAEMHGGTIEAVSEKGSQTRFTVRLPVVQSA